MQAQLARVSAMQAKSTNSTDSSTNASLSTRPTAARRLHIIITELFDQSH